MMKGVCPNCEKISELEHIITTEELNVKGECQATIILEV